MFVSKSHVLFLLVWIRLSLLPSPQIKFNCRAGKALEHTEVLLWYLVIKESKTATCQLVLQQVKQTLFRSQTKFQSQNEMSRKICIFRCKNHLSIQGKNSNSCKKLSRNQNNFSSCQQVRRVQQYLEQTPPSARFSRVLCSRYTIASNVPVAYFYPQIINFFLGGKNQPNYIQRKALFVFSYIFTSTKSVGKESANDI